MRSVVVMAAVLALALAGCESKRMAQQEARAAFLAGQQQEMQREQQQQQQQVASVQVRGKVQFPVVPFTDGLTVSRAIVAANYTEFMNPRAIRVIRNGQVIQEFKPIDLEQGHDMPLQPGDVVEIVP